MSYRYIIRKPGRWFLMVVLSLVSMVAICARGNGQAGVAQANVITIDSAIGPAVADYVVRNIQRANTQGAKLIVLQLDTPGGLGTSMRRIIQAVLASQIPVVGYVAPGGARAASAGTFILYACHIAAMAPGTNLGAASPVSVVPSSSQPSAQQATLKRKVYSDSQAYIRSLAQLRGRNEHWAVSAVKKAASLSDKEALKRSVINLIAQDIPDLLKRINGMTVKIKGHQVVIHSTGLTLLRSQPSWPDRFIMAITSPNLTYLLLMAGIAGILIEVFHPGVVFPGVIGAICLLLSAYALALLPVSYVGLTLIVLGLVFIIAEAFFTSYFVLGVGGVIALMIGSIMLIRTDLPGFGISWGLTIGVPLILGALLIGLLGIIVHDKRVGVRTTQDSIEGQEGDVVDINNQLWLQCRGELLRIDNPQQLAAGDRVTAVSVDGARVIVAAVSQD